MRSLSEGDAIGRAGEGEGKQTESIKEIESAEVGNDGREEKSKREGGGERGGGAKEVKDGVALAAKQGGGAEEEATKAAVKSIRSLKEENLLDYLSDIYLEEDSSTTPPTRRIRKKAKKQNSKKDRAESLGRRDTVVRQMLVRGSKRPPLFPPSADCWPGGI